MVRDGDHNRLPDEEVTTAELGIRYLRAQDLCEGEITADAPIFITKRYFATVARSHIKPSYLLFSIMASIGNAAVVPADFPPATANRAVGILVPKAQDPSLTFYLFFLFATNLGSEIYTRIKKGGLQQRTNLADVEALEFPLPPKSTREALVKAMDAAQAERRAKLSDANGLLAELDRLLLKHAGLSEPVSPKRTFAIKSGELVEMLNPDRYRAMELEKHLPFKTTVADVGVLLDARCSPEKEAPKDMWDWIRIDDLPSQPWQVESVRTDHGENIAGTFFEVRENDILIARLGPTIMNAKFVLCPKLVRRTVASSEFLVLRCNADWRPAAALWMLRTKVYRNIMYLRCRGGTPSRFRLDRGDLAAIPFPALNLDAQTAITLEVQRSLEASRRLRAEADLGWEAAKKWFEEQLLSPLQP